MSVPGLRALGDLDALVQQQLSVLAAEAEDEGTLLHRHPAGRLLPEWTQDRSEDGGQGHPRDQSNLGGYTIPLIN